MQAYLALGKLTAPSSNTLQPGLGAPPNPTSGLAFTARGRGFALARKLAWKSYHVHKSRKLHMEWVPPASLARSKPGRWASDISVLRGKNNNKGFF